MTQPSNHQSATTSTLSAALTDGETAFALTIPGQGMPWLDTLATADDAHSVVANLLTASAQRLHPVADELASARPTDFTPLQWITDGQCPADPLIPSLSVPGILLTQIATIHSLQEQGLDLSVNQHAVGHSQGELTAQWLNNGYDTAEILAIAQLIGAAGGRQAVATGLSGTHTVTDQSGESTTYTPLLAVNGCSRQQLETLLQRLVPTGRTPKSECRLRNGYDGWVIVGAPSQLAELSTQLRTQGLTTEPIATAIGFHHSALAPAVDQVQQWAEACGIDGQRARTCAAAVLSDFVDWPAQVAAATDAIAQANSEGTGILLDLGPDKGVSMLTAALAQGRGVAVVSAGTDAGQDQLFTPGAPRPTAVNYADFAPRIRTVNGRDVVDTAFTRLTGRSPIILAGMTPTTVDPQIVAAAANGGHWAELAGGGQVTPDIFHTHIAALTKQLAPGIAAEFNALYLDPKLWGRHIAGAKLVQKARAAGHPIDGVVISAGIPETAEAVSVITELAAAGLQYVCLKPGTIAQINSVLAIADELAQQQPQLALIVQIEGGAAGGHHSSENLDELLVATYDQCRQRPNVILCAGGGIGTPQGAHEYLTGQWSTRFGTDTDGETNADSAALPPMPVDAVLVGTAAMACAESTASDAVKAALVDATAADVISGRSQLGAAIHEINNSWAQTGLLLDEVAGDDDAIKARRQEIITALNRTAKPYFGELSQLTYRQWLERYLQLSGPWQDSQRGAAGGWKDVSWLRRFDQLIARTEARLSPINEGTVQRQVIVPTDVSQCEMTVAQSQQYITELAGHYDLDQPLHPADQAWFIQLLDQPGKPPNFVAVIDKDVRRRFRSDSLWQAHDERYSADAVSIIPGPDASDSIVRADEPVAQLLDRCEEETLRVLEQTGADHVATEAAEASESPESPEASAYSRRTLQACGCSANSVDPLVAAVAASPDISWAGRHQRNVVWQIAHPSQWSSDGQGGLVAPDGQASLKRDGDDVRFSAPLPRGEVVIRIAGEASHAALAAGGCAVVTVDDAAEAMRQLCGIAAGGQLPAVHDGQAECTAELTSLRAAEHMMIIESSQVSADVLVGLAWPAIFAVVSEAKLADGTPVVEGMLDLVHLQHELQLTDTGSETLDELVAAAGNDTVDITATATLQQAADTAQGRIVDVQATVHRRSDDTLLATLDERFTIRDRGLSTGPAPSEEPEAQKTDWIQPTPHAQRGGRRLIAPADMSAFAHITGDHNPIHVSEVAAHLARLDAPIVHGMWLSAAASAVAAADGAQIIQWQATMLAPLMPGSTVEITAVRTGIDTRPGGDEVREITATVDDLPIFTATAVTRAPATFYVFPGQGIQHQGMGMSAYTSDPAAKAVWDEADAHTRQSLGFSILTIVRDNPQSIVVGDTTYRHPQGVLHLTQFTQVAMATLAMAQVAQLRAAGRLHTQAGFAGHSVGEYTALAALAGALSLQSVVEIVYARGLTMHRLVPRDAKGQSDYGLAALRPHRAGIAEADVVSFVQSVAEASGEFLEVVNLNIAGRQYAVAGSKAGLAALLAESQRRAEEIGKTKPVIVIPGIDVPFHSSRLNGGVDDFRAELQRLVPQDLDRHRLEGRYIPNLVATVFRLDLGFLLAISDVVPQSPIIRGLLADALSAGCTEPEDTLPGDHDELARTLLIELLAWQFASPVRWIETQELILRGEYDAGSGRQLQPAADRIVEVGVGQSPTLANMFGQTLALPRFRDCAPVVWNLERDSELVFAQDESSLDPAQWESDPQSSRRITAAGSQNSSAGSASGDASAASGSEAPHDAAAAEETSAASAPAPSTPDSPACPSASASSSQGGNSANNPAIDFTAADATGVLIAQWTKLQPGQIMPTDTIESLVDGLSSRRNQLLMDMGSECGVGAIDGAADAPVPQLLATVQSLAGSYQPLGPVLSVSIGDGLKRLCGPAGVPVSSIADYLNDSWNLSGGWVEHVSCAMVLGTRDGQSVRGGDLAELSATQPSSRSELDSLIDAAVQQVAAARGVSVAKPANDSHGGGVVDSAALSQLHQEVMGADGVLASTARELLTRLNISLDTPYAGYGAEAAVAGRESAAEDKQIIAAVTRELGADWPRKVAPAFDARQAFVIDDRWASVRDDLARAVRAALRGETADAPSLAALDLRGAGQAAADHARWWAQLCQSRADVAEPSDLAHRAQSAARQLQKLASDAMDTTAATLSGKIAVVTGAAPDSIAGAVVGQLLGQGATVIVTASRLTAARRQWLADLYRRHGRCGSALWAVPTNVASYDDIDSLVRWIGEPMVETVGAESVEKKPAMTPDLLFPFAAGPVAGTAAQAGAEHDMHLRMLLTGVERLTVGLSALGADTDVAHRLHVVLPGSPNRGRFGGDGAYGEAKAALDAFVQRWSAEQGWARRVSMVHALIGWVRGTGLMGGNDPLVDAVEAAGVRTYSTHEMAQQLVRSAQQSLGTPAGALPLTVDLTGGLGEADIDLAQLAQDAAASAHAPDTSAMETTSGSESEAGSGASSTVQALPYRAPRATADTAAGADTLSAKDFAGGTATLDDTIVIVGAGELSAVGSSRTRWDLESNGQLSAPGVVELAWSCGLIEWKDGAEPGFYDKDDQLVPESEIAERYRDEVMGRIGIRTFSDDGQLNGDNQIELVTIYTEQPVEFVVDSAAEAQQYVDADPQHTTVFADTSGEQQDRWVVRRAAHAPVRVPRHVTATRWVGGQVPDDFTPNVFGIPPELCENLDRVALWNLVCTVDAFTQCGISPAELMEYIHPARVSSSQGTGMGGMRSLRRMYLDRLLGEPRPNDILQEALPNVLAAHVMQSYVGGYGQMIHPVAACATAAVSVEVGLDLIRLDKADVVVTGGYDDISGESVSGFGAMEATANSTAMAQQGFAPGEYSRANDRRRGGFVEAAGGGTVVLARASVAADLGLPVLGVVAYAQSFADGAHTSIPAPGQGAVSAAMATSTGKHGVADTQLGAALSRVGATADDIAVISKHDTSTNANDPNESLLHETIAQAMGRSDGNPLAVVSQKALTGHAKGGAAAFQLIGLTQVLGSAVVPGNHNLECVDPQLQRHPHLLWPRTALRLPTPPKAGLVTSLGFGHVSALIALVHAAAFEAIVLRERGEAALTQWQQQSSQRTADGQKRREAMIYGGRSCYQRPSKRRLGSAAEPDSRGQKLSASEREKASLLDPTTRVVAGLLTPQLGAQSASESADGRS